MNEPIHELDSAYLNLNTALGDIKTAREDWMKEKWPDCLMWINSALSQLEAARAKIQRHQCQPSE